MTRSHIALMFTLACLFPVAAIAQVPGILTYQGRITTHGTNFTGTGQFKFALVRPGFLGATLWSQDGKDRPATSIAVPVTDGLFTVALGDTSLPGMTQPIPADAFQGPNVSLRIWFDDGTSGFELLTPDQRLTSVGYALRAESVAQGSITGVQLAPAAVGTAALADGSVTTPKLASGAVTGDKIAADTITGQKIAPNSVTSDDIASTLRLQDLQVESADGLDRVRIMEENNSGVLYMNHGTIGRFLAASGTTDGGFLRLYDAFGGIGVAQTTAELGSSSSGGYLSLFQDNKSSGVLLQGQSGATPGGAILLYRQNGLGISLQGSTGNGQGSLINLRNNANDVTVAIDGDSSGAGQVDVRSATGSTRVRLDGTSTNTSGEISVFDDNGTETIELVGNSSAVTGGQLLMRGNGGSTTVRLEAENGANQGAELNLFNGTGDATVVLDADGLDHSGSLALGNGTGHYGAFLDGGYNGFGRFQLSNAAGSPRVRIDGEAEGDGETGGEVRLNDASGTATVRLIGAQTASSGGRIELNQANGTNTVILDGEVGNGGGGYLQLRNGSGVGTITLDSDLGGEGRITTQVLRITGGSDLSEQFDIRPSAVPPQPGMIVCIDARNPGELAVSRGTYDRTVAGVMSGAGGVRPGMLMGQAGTRADGQHPVALTGRVYCLVDASRGPIEPGDLITTSETPGHGMKVSDHARAQGAIVGKAMTGLASGRGLVLILVSLQ